MKILAIFYEWKNEAGKFSERFVARETYKDLVWLIGGLVCACTMYLKEDKSLILAQERCTSDDCEFHFGNIRSRNPSASVKDCEHGTAHAQATRTHTFSTRGTGNNSGKRKESKSELFAPMKHRKT